MSNTDLTIQVLRKDDGEEEFSVLTERKLRYSSRYTRSKTLQSQSSEFWSNDGNTVGELDWDVLIVTSDQDVDLDLWSTTSQLDKSTGYRHFLRGGTWLVLRRELWVQVAVATTGNPFQDGAEADIVLIEVAERKGNKANVRGRFYKQATS